jgi:hypothetical protein
MRLELSQKNDLDFVQIAEIKIQLRITAASKMINSINNLIEEMEELYKIVNSKKKWA